MTELYKEQCGSTPTGLIPSDSSWPGSAKDEDRLLILAYLEDRFGIPGSAFDDYLMLEKNRSWWLLRRSPHLISIQSYKVLAWGMKAFQRVGEYMKPTTRAVQVFGNLATKAVVHLDDEKLHSMINGKDLFIDTILENGYVILVLGSHVLGLGLLINSRVRLQIRKSDLKSFSFRVDV
jgi:NOL1/NOP2/fmu family ribosome biogenesis protein